MTAKQQEALALTGDIKRIAKRLKQLLPRLSTVARDLADQAGLSAKTLAEFLVGRAVLDSVAVDKLAALLKQQLTPIAL